MQNNPKKIIFLLLAAEGFLLIILLGSYNFSSKTPTEPTQIVCTADAKECPDGSYVSRIPPTCDFTKCPNSPIFPTSTVDETINWKTYNNVVYHYSIEYPPDFQFELAKDYSPPESCVSIHSPDRSFYIGICEPSGSLSGNAGPGQLKTIIGPQFKINNNIYSPSEAYYDNYYNYYIFNIDDIVFNNKPFKLGIGGRYTKSEDVDKISQILSTFKFFE